MEQLNIVGKRSGDNGFVAHKATLVNALSRVLADRVMVGDFTVGRKGFLGYVKALAGSNIIRVIPANGDASVSQVNGNKRLKVTCGSNTSYLEDLAWVGEKTPLTLCEVRVSSKRIVQPNIGGLELAEALNRVLPFTAKEDNRPVLQCVLFKAGEGKLTLVSADGFRLAVVTLDCDVEGQALIHRDELRGIANALRKAHRVNLSFEQSGDSLDGSSLVIDTELMRYKWRGADGQFPDYEKLIPTETYITAHFDTVEAGKAIAPLKALADSKSYPIDLHLNGGIVMSSPDDKGEVTIPADIEGGEVRVRIDGAYLTEALKACGGMVDFKLTDGNSPVLFTVDGYQLVNMPMLTGAGDKVEAEAEPATEADTETAEAVAEAEAITKAEKPKRNRKREKVAVA
ncbi:MAG: DNA polymerase III subunit beta [Dehalococcoidales bacterium]|nr:DNA polymerase III subunit beta [Dehalococcoidales bacterium]